MALLSGLLAWGLTGDPDEADEWRLLRRREGYEDAREVLLQWTTYEDVRAYDLANERLIDFLAPLKAAAVACGFFSLLLI